MLLPHNPSPQPAYQSGLTLPNPLEIETAEPFWNTFHQREPEISARWIVRFLQHREYFHGGDEQDWAPFPLTHLECFYQEAGHRDFWFNGLIGTFLVEETRETGKWIVPTVGFVQQCAQGRQRPAPGSTAFRDYLAQQGKTYDDFIAQFERKALTDADRS